MYWGTFYQKDLFMRGRFTKKSFHGESFGGNLWGEVVVHGGTYDQMMSRGEGDLYKCIFQQSEHCKFFLQPCWNIHLKIKP